MSSEDDKAGSSGADAKASGADAKASGADAKASGADAKASGADAKASGEGFVDDDVDVAEIEVPALSALLKRSLASVEPEAASTVEVEAEREKKLLLGVQRKLRQRSKGKFYADGWSTSQSRVNYALVAGVMLVVIAAVYLALGPMGISPH
jgi:hypothetical protein